MCDPVSLTVGAISLAGSVAMGAKNAHDQRKAEKATREEQRKAEARTRAIEEARGATQIARADTAAADAEKKRRQAVAYNSGNVLTSRQGALGQANTASTALAGQPVSRTTLG